MNLDSSQPRSQLSRQDPKLSQAGPQISQHVFLLSQAQPSVSSVLPTQPSSSQPEIEDWWGQFYFQSEK
ncbi:hypothetical protein HK096_008446, partial [Nowakowskiella sp. JEL0078]